MADIETTKIGLADLLDDYLSLKRLAEIGRLSQEETAKLYLYRNTLNGLRITIYDPKPSRAPFVVTDKKAAEIEAEERYEAKLNGEPRKSVW